MDVGGEGGEIGNTPNIQDDHQIHLYELLNQQGCTTTHKMSYKLVELLMNATKAFQTSK
jgi:hypothetical protein